MRAGRRFNGSVHDQRFEELVRAHHGSVRTYARSLASTPTIAEDATQETFLRAWRYLDSFRGEGSFEGWLIRICRNCLHDLEARERPSVDLANVVWSLAEPADHSSELLAVVQELPLAQREVVVLCGVLGYDYETAATILDTPVGTIRSRLSRARAALAALIDERPAHVG